MTATQTFVIVGAGLAAGKAVQELRESGFDGHLVLYGAESHLPYERPPLSKGYLTGDDSFESALVQPPDWYDAHAVDLRLGTRVAAVDPVARAVTAAGATQRYDKLLLATGSRPRHLAMADDSGAPVAYLRTVEDSDLIRSRLRAEHRLVIIGGGWIGLEVAAAARRAGAHVTLLEALDLPLVRVLGPEVARTFAALHQAHGVDLRMKTVVSSIEADGGVAIVTLADGSSVEADLLVVGIGVTPDITLAEAAGLRTDNGILVDHQLRSSEPDIFAAGDIANAYHPLLGRHVRVEHWDNAIGQGVVAAQNMLGKDVSYDRLPYFFSDQYDLGMEYLGNVGPDGYDRVVLRGTPDKGTFTAFWLREGRVLAGMHANDWDAMDAIRHIVGGQRPVAGLEDESVSLAQIAANLD
ncbi:FAD-dependent oxidoreductase [Nocardioides agariphilus]|jgi:NADPH-dependent 2,4-dienoyl-CoA reductase/sulfur reductase-like enzyme|uniref:FAD-dependent oxidoreductase n=1 Tax=Nocardioides agariphilus TaxID=433664 RepID=A0A930VIK1_9ACTN|nr:FAD-dependent oxidoreductase [Nocardioides agariphilus]MBF4766276.1 FAD-dependent oxidoreductase [Nocardioides agariphilus]